MQVSSVEGLRDCVWLGSLRLGVMAKGTNSPGVPAGALFAVKLNSNVVESMPFT